MICRILYPDTIEPWRFRNTLGIGYFAPHPSASLTAASTTTELAVARAALSPAISSAETGVFGADAMRMLLRTREKLAALDPQRLQTAEAIYQLEITGTQGGSLSICVKAGKTSVEAGANSEARVILALSADVLEKLLDGKLNATVAYMTKKLKIRGDITLAMKLESLLK
jgi:putative sterol carrier protein